MNETPIYRAAALLIDEDDEEGGVHSEKEVNEFELVLKEFCCSFCGIIY